MFSQVLNVPLACLLLFLYKYLERKKKQNPPTQWEINLRFLQTPKAMLLWLQMLQIKI